MTRYRPALGLLLAPLLALVSHDPASAQAIGATATLTGQVIDISGAAIPGVRMSLENADTGVTVEGESNEIGYYRFSLLRPDTYTLRAEVPGFNIASVSDIVLQVAKTSNVNITLEPSTVQEVVTVAASAITVDSQTSDLGEVVAERPVKKLPLLLRDPTYRPVQKSCQRNWPSTWSAHSLSANLLVWKLQIYLDSSVLLLPRRLRFESTSSCVSSPARPLHPLPVAFRSQPARSTAGLSGPLLADSTT